MKLLTSSLIAVLILSAAFASATPQTHKSSSTGVHVAKKRHHHGAGWLSRMFTLPKHHHHRHHK